MGLPNVDFMFHVRPILLISSITFLACTASVFRTAHSQEKVTLPAPRLTGNVSIEETLNNRRSIRAYTNTPLKIAEVSQLVWAAQGVTSNERGLRTAPSGGATYPLELYVVAGNVEGLSPGVYRYIPKEHALQRVMEGDKRVALKDCTLNQNFVADAPVSFVFFAVYERITKKYGERGIRYAHMEAGHAAENVYLQGVALGIDTVVVGAFTDEKVSALFKSPDGEYPMYIMPLGRKPAK